MTVAQGVADELKRIGQHTLAEYLTECDPALGSRIAGTLNAFDLDELGSYIDRYGASYTPDAPPTDLSAPKAFALGGDWDRDHYRAQGETLIRAGKLACFVVAGGQGSRLGFDGPKGCFPTGCVTGKPLFQIFAESIRGANARYSVRIPWMIMTSPLNHDATVSFFQEHDFFGLDPDDVLFFQQGVMPSFDARSGDLLLSAPDALATNPDGHGGSYAAMERSGALDALEQRGIEHISYFQVDNPHTRIVDPVFLGLHAHAPESSGEISSKMIAKASWDEKVGVFCDVGGTTSIVEYSDLPEALAKQTRPDGTLEFNAGSVAIHIMSTVFIRKVLADKDRALPFHRAVKKVPLFDPKTGSSVDPDSPNAVKLERFVFDALGVAAKPIILETDRVEEFAPVKNASGNDSIESSRALQTERGARWLESRGVTVPRNQDGSVNAKIEISGLAASCADELADSAIPGSIEPGAEIVIG